MGTVGPPGGWATIPGDGGVRRWSKKGSVSSLYQKNCENVIFKQKVAIFERVFDFLRKNTFLSENFHILTFLSKNPALLGVAEIVGVGMGVKRSRISLCCPTWVGGSPPTLTYG